MKKAPAPAPGASATERTLFIVGEHLRHARLSHQQACTLQALGHAEQAREQSRMTRVFLHNALQRLGLHAPPEH